MSSYKVLRIVLNVESSPVCWLFIILERDLHEGRNSLSRVHCYVAGSQMLSGT